MVKMLVKFWNWLNGTEELLQKFENKRKLNLAVAEEALDKIQKRENELPTLLADGDSCSQDWPLMQDIQERRSQWERFSHKLERLTPTSC